MSEWPEVVICLVTFARTKYAIATIEGIKKYLKYPNLSWHVADDGSGDKHQDAIVAAIGDEHWTLTDAHQKGGAGYNRNVGLQAAFRRADYVLHIEDDWALTQEYILRPAVLALRDHPNLGMVRFGYLEAGHTGRTRALGGLIWWQLNKDSGHRFVFTGHPHLLHKRFHDTYSWYEENLLPGLTEATFAAKFLEKDGPGIIYPIWHFGGFFAHIGSVKAEEYLCKLGQ